MVTEPVTFEEVKIFADEEGFTIVGDSGSQLILSHKDFGDYAVKNTPLGYQYALGWMITMVEQRLNSFD